MVNTPAKTTEETKEHSASIEVPRQDEVTKEDAKTAQQQAKATGGADAEVHARVLTAEQTRQAALKADEDKGLVNGIPKKEWETMSLGQQRRAELNNPYSDLRNQL